MTQVVTVAAHPSLERHMRCVQWRIKLGEMLPDVGQGISMHLQYTRVSQPLMPRKQLRRAIETVKECTGGEVEFSAQEGYIQTKVGSTLPMKMSEIEEITRALRQEFSEFGPAAIKNEKLESSLHPGRTATAEQAEWEKRNHFYLVLSDPINQIEVFEHKPTEKQAKLLGQLTAPVIVQAAEEEV